jgi:hypothetical protein
MHSAARRDLLILEGMKNRGVVAQAGQRLEQLIELPRLLEHVKPTERSDNALANSAIDTFVVNDLDVLVLSGLLDASKQRALRFQYPLRIIIPHSGISIATRPTVQFLALHIRPIFPNWLHQQTTYVNFGHQTVEDRLEYR